MPQHFLDSSALLKRYRQETGSQWMLQLTQTSDRIVISRLAQLEVTAAIVRRARQAGNTPQQVAAALASLNREIAEMFEVIELAGPVIPQATALTKTHALRAADAIQLSCAMLARPEPSADYYRVSADDELNTAAAAEGLGVEN